ncbi:MAG: family 10 glycosylhydrolase, partial [Candidatus Gastranaerophilales bacterium]|nr:family 10 glycosylhydrolase [Candidatus Gastranaerophilales bacterium]
GIIMKKFLLSGIILLMGGIQAFSQEITLLDPFAEIKQEISEYHQILSFENRRISAMYPSEIINRAGMNYPGYRGPGQLVVYFPGFAYSTGTNEFGTEAVVENGIVVRLTGADSVIPKDGFVISGHGSSKKWIKDNLKIGTNIIIDGSTLIAYTTPDSYIFNAKERLEDAEDFVDNAKKSGDEDKKAAFYLKKAKSELKKAERARENLKKSYAESSVSLSNLAIKYALPYIETEFKGVWLRPVEKNVFEIRKTLDNIQKTGINEIFLETWFHGYTIYPSKVMKKYGLTLQNPKFLMYDPLRIYIDEAHKRGIKIHCWFESFYVGNNYPLNDSSSVLAVYPSWGNKNLANYDSEDYVSHKVEHGGYFLDPANPDVRTFLNELIAEIVTNYAPDGINLDYTRYPSAQRPDVANFKQSNWGYSEFARNEFMELNEVDPVEIEPDTPLWQSWNLYRQNKIYDYVKNIRDTVPKGVMLSSVVFPDYELCLETKQQDWVQWTKDDLIDAVTPLIMTADNELFQKILKSVKSNVEGKTEIITGLFVGFLDAEPEDLLKQISVSRALKSSGVILFDWAHLPVKYQNALQYRVFMPK